MKLLAEFVAALGPMIRVAPEPELLMVTLPEVLAVRAEVSVAREPMVPEADVRVSEAAVRVPADWEMLPEP